jgi:hypothetical protein
MHPIKIPAKRIIGIVKSPRFAVLSNPMGKGPSQEVREGRVLEEKFQDKKYQGESRNR